MNDAGSPDGVKILWPTAGEITVEVDPKIMRFGECLCEDCCEVRHENAAEISPLADTMIRQVRDWAYTCGEVENQEEEDVDMQSYVRKNEKNAVYQLIEYIVGLEKIRDTYDLERTAKVS